MRSLWCLPVRLTMMGPQDIIGGTVLSWGENVPEVVATLTLARAGQGTMALAACFAGPVFNLAVRGALSLSLPADGLLDMWPIRPNDADSEPGLVLCLPVEADNERGLQSYCSPSQAMGVQVGLGGPVLLQGAKRGGAGLPVRLTNGILLLGAQSVRADALHLCSVAAGCSPASFSQVQ